MKTDNGETEPPSDPPTDPLGVGEWHEDDGGAWGPGGGFLPPLPPEPPPPRPFVVPRDVVTRMLCSSVHLQGSFCDHVLDTLVDPTHQAMAPNWTIDTPTVVRHAMQSRARRTERDTWLLGLCSALIFLVGTAGVLLATQRISVPTFLYIAVGVYLVVYLFAFGIVWWHYNLIRQSALGAIGIKDTGAEEPLDLDPELEETLLAADRANTVLFAGSKPFVGSGERIDRWTVTVDIGLGARNSQGSRGVPERFDAKELHEYLSKEIPREMGLEPRVGHRLYVVGGHALGVPGLFRSGPVPEDGEALVHFRRPVPSVPDHVIVEFMNGPQTSARPYTFFELKAWDGQVVVTLFVRVVVKGPSMFVELAVCALRPPQSQFGEVTGIALGTRNQRWPIFRTVLPRTTRLLLTSPARQYRFLRAGYSYRRALEDLELTLRERFDVNFAAGPSLREEIARGDNALHFGFVDEEMFYRVMTQTAMDCLGTFLNERNIDTADFERQQIKVQEKRMTNALDIYGIHS